MQKPKKPLKNCLPAIMIQPNFNVHNMFLHNPEGVWSILNYLEITQCIMLLYCSLSLLTFPGRSSDISFHLLFPNFYLICIFSFRTEVQCYFLLEPPLSTLGSNDHPYRSLCYVLFRHLSEHLEVTCWYVKILFIVHCFSPIASWYTGKVQCIVYCRLYE